MGLLPFGFSGAYMLQAQIKHHPAQADGDGWKQDVEGDVGRELDSGKIERREFHTAPHKPNWLHDHDHK